MSRSVFLFVEDFENKFKDLLIIPSASPNKKSFSKFFLYFGEPKKIFSDWDLDCFLDDGKLSGEIILQIDSFIKEHSVFSDVAIFSKPQNEVETLLQYMAYFRNEHFAPFLDLHLNSNFTRSIWSKIYHQDDSDHLRWSLITAWRKMLNNNIEEARSVFSGHFNNLPGEFESFIKDPKTYYYINFPNIQPPDILLKNRS